MKLLSVTLPFLLASSAFAGFEFSTSKQQAVVKDDDSLSVPGDNPLSFCSAPDDDILTIDRVNISPNPPQAGKPLVVSANGTLHSAVNEDAKVHLQVKYGLITLINQEAKLCDYVENVDLSCPLDKGNLNLTKSVDLPSQIPPGKYTVLADVFTSDGDKITCLTASLVFKRGGS